MAHRHGLTLGRTFNCKFNTTNNGVPFVLAGSPVVSAYVDDGTTQLTAGITLTVDFDSVVGLNNVKVVLTAANGYARKTDVQLVITTGTVNGSSVVGTVIASFFIDDTRTLAVVADGANSATTFVTDLTETDPDYWEDAWFRITSGALIDQVKKCSAYNGTSKAITFLGGYTGTPANGVTLEVVND